MIRQIFKKGFSFIFLSIFFLKMLIAAMPLIAHHFDSKSVYAVIMQLEIEHNCSKDSKDTSGKADWYDKNCTYVFYQSHENVIQNSFIILDDKAVQAFYPSVPTPPPNVS